MSKPTEYKLEDHINDWVKKQFERLNLSNQKDYYTESAIPDYLKDALKGRAKTKNKTMVMLCLGKIHANKHFLRKLDVSISRT